MAHAPDLACAHAEQGAEKKGGSQLEAVLGLPGLEDKDMRASDTLLSLGVESMQLADLYRALRALCRPVPMEEVCTCFLYQW